MMMFSFSPFRSSRAPRTAASVRTRVVSWKEAAEMKDSVVRLALVIPRRRGSERAGFPRLERPLVHLAELHPVHVLALEELVSPGSVIRTFWSIWRTITPMCLSLIFTPCSR
jgi:hypothetical protein